MPRRRVRLDTGGRVRGVRGCVAVALLALMTCTGTAEAAPASVSGSLVVRWQSNPDTCATAGLCNRSGSLSWRPALDFTAVSFGGGGFQFLSFFGSEAVARSYRSGGDSTATCIDRNAAPTDIEIESSGRNGTVVLSMRRSEGFGFGRCAGPLGSDFAGALPESRPIKVADARRGGLIDLRGRTPFSAGPFTGEVISTLTLRARPEPRDDEDSSRSITHTIAPSKKPRARYGE